MSLSFGAGIQSVLPQRLIGRFIYHLARCRIRWVKGLLIRSFRTCYSIDLEEAEETDTAAYPDFNSFFTRGLKAGARPMADDPLQAVSPADGTLTEFGDLEDGRLLQAKGMRYSLSELTGEPPTELGDYVRGRFATVYLAPRNYHRVHAPVAGRLRSTRYIPGARYCVNVRTASAIRNLFCRNERVVLHIDGDRSPYFLVMVGALNVSSISTAARGEIKSGRGRIWTETEPTRTSIGAELGRFNLGSTVVLVFPRGSIRWAETLRNGMPILMGERIGSLSGSSGPQ